MLTKTALGLIVCLGLLSFMAAITTTGRIVHKNCTLLIFTILKQVNS